MAAQFTSVRPEPGQSVVLVVEGGLVQMGGKYGPKLLLWNKTKQQNLELPPKMGDLLVAMGLGAYEESNGKKYLKPFTPTAVKFTRPGEAKQPWTAEFAANSGEQARPAAPERRTLAPAGQQWETLRAQYTAAMIQGLDMVAGLDAVLTKRALQNAAVTIDLNAIAFTLFKQARDMGVTIPTTTVREELATVPSGLEEEDDLPF